MNGWSRSRDCFCRWGHVSGLEYNRWHGMPSMHTCLQWSNEPSQKGHAFLGCQAHDAILDVAGHESLGLQCLLCFLKTSRRSPCMPQSAQERRVSTWEKFTWRPFWPLTTTLFCAATGNLRAVRRHSRQPRGGSSDHCAYHAALQDTILSIECC